MDPVQDRLWEELNEEPRGDLKVTVDEDISGHLNGWTIFYLPIEELEFSLSEDELDEFLHWAGEAYNGLTFSLGREEDWPDWMQAAAGGQTKIAASWLRREYREYVRGEHVANRLGLSNLKPRHQS